MADTLSEIELLAILGIGGLIVYFLVQNKDSIVPKQTTLGGPNNQPGLASGVSESGFPYSQATGSGAITVWPAGIDGKPVTYSQSSVIGPTGQTMAQLLASGWSYSDVADYIGMQNPIPAGAIA